MGAGEGAATRASLGGKRSSAADCGAAHVSQAEMTSGVPFELCNLWFFSKPVLLGAVAVASGCID